MGPRPQLDPEIRRAAALTWPMGCELVCCLRVSVTWQLAGRGWPVQRTSMSRRTSRAKPPGKRTSSSNVSLPMYLSADLLKPSVIVWDLETVPDLGGFAAAKDLVGKPDVEVREAIGDKFPKHIYHSIVCIGALIAHREPDDWAVDAVGAPHVVDRTEKQLITAFCDKIAELSPQLVTFNGSS